MKKNAKGKSKYIGPGTPGASWGKLSVNVGRKLTEGAAEYACQEENRIGRKRDAAKLKRKQGKKNGKGQEER